MTTIPELPTPAPSVPVVPASPDDPIADADHAHTERCESSGQYLAGVIAAGTLDHVGRPGKLPELLWPDADPVLVRAVWEAGLATGYRAGKLAAHPEWTAEGLDKLRAALHDAGYQGMARLTARSAAVHRPVRSAPAVHPADREMPADATAVRPGGRP